MCCGPKASARRVFHIEVLQALFAFADLVNRKNVWMVKARDRFSFAPKTRQRLMGVNLMSEDALHCNDPA